MESDEIEKYFPKKPHRRRFKKAIKEKKKTTSTKPSKMPKPVVDHKFALIIGNGNYSTGPLGLNPINDAQVVREKFESEYGYKVFYHENLECKEMNEALNEFEDALSQETGKSLAVVFFAGHGVQITTNKGVVENLLLGIDNVYKNETERQMQRKEISTKKVVEALEAADVSIKIMLLDCCRNVSGLPRFMASKTRSITRSGFAREELEGCMILYACQPGEEALNGDSKNGLFTKSLMEAFESQRNERNSPRFSDLVKEAEKIMKDRNQHPAVEIPCMGDCNDICIDGTLFKHWYQTLL
eukprot:jgi/Bigna1/69701/fgenesh1_pg.9_\